MSSDKFFFFSFSWGEIGRYFRYFKSCALFCYKTENVRNTMSDLNPPGQNNKSCMLRMPMFIFLVSWTSIKFQLSIDKKTIYALCWPTRTEVTLTNLALDRIVCLIRIRSRMLVYCVHCTFCITLNLAPETYSSNDRISKENTINIKLIPLCEERLSLEVFCVCFIKRELACIFTDMSH